MFYKILFLNISQNSLEITCARVSFLIKLQASLQLYLKRNFGTGVSCEFCETFKNTFFTEHLRATASVFCYTLKFQAMDLKKIQPSHKNLARIIHCALLQLKELRQGMTDNIFSKYFHKFPLELEKPY